mmetsp:Transcript_65824/g.125470  ORF Transcript_65824/g.125470 Transcript_65824/m.125470 type:complete len:292 (+) Transcript_65824:114-989(+)
MFNPLRSLQILAVSLHLTAAFNPSSPRVQVAEDNPTSKSHPCNYNLVTNPSVSWQSKLPKVERRVVEGGGAKPNSLVWQRRTSLLLLSADAERRRCSRGCSHSNRQGQKRGRGYRSMMHSQGLLGAKDPLQVTHCLTVQGPQQGAAMVTGRKQIENRAWRIPFGWYALHVGSQPLSAIGEEWCERMRKAWPDAPPERSLPASRIVGLIHISEQRRPADCPAEHEHPQAVWAAGPICHVIDQAIQLNRPIPHSGSKGLWEISKDARQRLVRQLETLSIQRFEELPRRGDRQA